MSRSDVLRCDTALHVHLQHQACLVPETEHLRFLHIAKLSVLLFSSIRQADRLPAEFHSRCLYLCHERLENSSRLDENFAHLVLVIQRKQYEPGTSADSNGLWRVMIAHRCISPCVLSLCPDYQQVYHRGEDNAFLDRKTAKVHSASTTTSVKDRTKEDRLPDRRQRQYPYNFPEGRNSQEHRKQTR